MPPYCLSRFYHDDLTESKLLTFWQTREQCLQLDHLYDILQSSICDARGEIDTFLDRVVSKYGKNLTCPSKRNPKDAAKMLQWHVWERDNITRLQEKLRKSKEVILVVQGQANL